jgi:hypothetical protein
MAKSNQHMVISLPQMEQISLGSESAFEEPLEDLQTLYPGSAS